jgi:hypothetical protein
LSTRSTWQIGSNTWGHGRTTRSSWQIWTWCSCPHKELVIRKYVVTEATSCETFFLMKEISLNCFSDKSTSCVDLQYLHTNTWILLNPHHIRHSHQHSRRKIWKGVCIPKEDAGSVGVPASLKLAPGVDTQPAPGVGASKGLPLGVSGCNNYKWHKSMWQTAFKYRRLYYEHNQSG